MLSRLALITALVVATTSFAQDVPGQPRRVTTYVFEDDADDFVPPPSTDESVVHVTTCGWRSLIRIRQDFRDKLMQSVNELR